MHNQGKKRHQYIFHHNMLSRDSQSTQLQNSPLPSKQVGGHYSIGMRRIYSSKTIETHSGLSANNLVYMCLHIPTNQPTYQPAPLSPGHWTALAPSGTFFSTKVAFSRLDTDFCSRSCQNNGRCSLLSAPYRCRPSRYATPVD